MGLLEDGDVIVLDVDRRVIEVELSDEQLAERQARWTQPAPKHSTGAVGEVRAAGLVGFTGGRDVLIYPVRVPGNTG